jgi:hypothetical protein
MSLFSCITDLINIQKKYALSNIHIIESTNGYNALSFDKLNFNELKKIMTDLKYIDKTFVEWGFKRGFFTLRMGKDKKYLNVLINNSNTYIKSNPHKTFLTKVMLFPIKDNLNFDNEKEITITMFPSNKHGFKKGEIKNAKYI